MWFSERSYRILRGRRTFEADHGTARAVADSSPGGSNRMENNTCHYGFPPAAPRP